MPLQMSTSLRNSLLDQIEVFIGASAVLKIRSGTKPGSVAAADAGSVLSTINLPADWMAAASGGSKAKSGTWQDGSADASGVATHWRLYASDGATCHLQGDVTVTGGGGEMTVDNTTFTAGQAFTIATFNINAPGA